jgi:transcriptional regulator with XRE-family HTH domain
MDALQDALDARADRLIADHRDLLKKLVEFRNQHHLSQEEVAARMGVSQPTVSAFERYDANPTLSTIRRYAMAVGVVLDTIVVDDCSDCMPSSWSPRSARQTALLSAALSPVATSIWDKPLAGAIEFDFGDYATTVPAERAHASS